MDSSTLIQGGRLRKTSRGIISFAPFLAAASAVVLGALFATGPASAGTCMHSDTGGTGGTGAGSLRTYTCSGAAANGDSSIDVILGFSGGSPEAANPRRVVIMDNGQAFGLSVADGSGISISSSNSSEYIRIMLTGAGGITTTDSTDGRAQNNQDADAINVGHVGTGTAVIDINGNLHAEAGSGIQVRSVNANNAGSTTISVTGKIGDRGDGNAVGKDGIYLFQNRGGATTISVTGDIWAGNAESFNLDRAGKTGTTINGGRGIYLMQMHAGGDRADVTVSSGTGTTGSIRSRGTGVHVDNAGMGRTRIVAGDVTSTGDKGIYARTHSRATGAGVNAGIDAKTVTAENEGIELFHNGGNEGRIVVSGTVTSVDEEAIIIRAPGIAAQTSEAAEGTPAEPAQASHLSVKVGSEARRGGSDLVTSAKDGITVYHMGGTTATADVRSYNYIRATNSTTQGMTAASGIRITMGENTGSADIMQADGSLAMPTITRIEGVTVRVLAHEEINAKTFGIDVNQRGTGSVRIVSSCSADNTTTAYSCITTAEGEGIRVSNRDSARVGEKNLGVKGNVDITANGEQGGTNRAIRSGATGVDVHLAASSNLTITANGEIEVTSEGRGIHVYQTGEQSGEGRIEITANRITAANTGTMANTTAGYGSGIRVNRDAGVGDLVITANGDITAAGATNRGGAGIDVHFQSNTTGGDISITTAAGTTITGSHAPGIDVDNFGGGDTTIILNSTVRRTGSNGVVINLTNGLAGTSRLVLGDGASVESGNSTANRDIEVTSSGGTSTASLELTGTREDKTLGFNQIGSFDSLEKTGSGTWTLTGAQDPEDTGRSEFALNRLTVNEGTLVLDLDPPVASETPALAFMGTMPMLEIAQGASLEINEDIFTTGGVTLALNGDLFLSGVDGGIDVRELTAGTDASLTVEVRFDEIGEMGEMEETEEMEEGEGEGGGVVLSHARLNVADGGATVDDSVTVNIIPSGTPTTLGNFIRVGGDAPMGANTFVAGNVVDSPVNFRLEHEEPEGGGSVWSLIPERIATAAAGGKGTIHDAFTAVLSELSQPETLHERLRDRRAKYGTNSWVKAYSANTQFTPLGASFDIENAGFQIGLRAPLQNVLDQNWASDSFFDASLEFGRAFTDAFVEAGMVDIQTETFALGLGTTYNHDKFYVDGQLRYAYFENHLDDEAMRLASPSADSLSASIEFGRVLGGGVSFGDIIGGSDAPGDFGIPDFKLVPSLQVSWSSVDFKPYTSATGIPVRLNDGDVFFGRIGALAQGEWDDVRFLYEGFSLADVRLRGHVNIVMPLDAEVVTDVMGIPMSSERVEPSLDAGVGIAYEWDDAYILHAGLSTQQGEEVEGYSGSIGFKHEF